MTLSNSMIAVRGIYPPGTLSPDLPRIENYLKDFVEQRLARGKSVRLSTKIMLRWITWGKCLPPPGVEKQNRLSLMNRLSFILVSFHPENGFVKRELEGPGFIYEFRPREG